MLSSNTTKQSSFPVLFNTNWRHLPGLRLADPEFGVPGNIDVLLGVDMFSRVVRQGQQQGPRGSPMVLETRLRLGLVRERRHNISLYRQVSCISMVLASDEMLPKLTHTKNSSSCLRRQTLGRTNVYCVT